MNQGRKVLIVGGAGFIGYHAVNQFLNRDYDVTAVSLPSKNKEMVFPKEVKVKIADINKLSDQELGEMLKGFWAVVFAAGADDRVTPPKPAYPFFYASNVESAKRFFEVARKAGVKRGVLLSSYFAYFDRIWPDLKLSKYHPYIRSRKEQEREVISVAGDGLDVMILELPYIFGTAPGLKPLWEPLFKYIKKTPTVYFTQGGTNMVSVKHVAEAIVGAIEKGTAGRRYVIGDENVNWTQFIEKILKTLDLKKKIVIVPNFVTGLMMSGVWLKHFFQGREGGLNPVRFVSLQGKKTYFDSSIARDELGFGKGGLDEALSETIKLCEKIQEK